MTNTTKSPAAVTIDLERSLMIGLREFCADVDCTNPVVTAYRGGFILVVEALRDGVPVTFDMNIAPKDPAAMFTCTAVVAL